MQREDGLDTMLDGQVWTELQEAVSRFRAALGAAIGRRSRRTCRPRETIGRCSWPSWCTRSWNTGSGRESTCPSDRTSTSTKN